MFIFVAIALTGFVLLLIAALFGEAHGDHEVAVEAAHEISMGDHPSPFSLRVVSLFLTAFGAAGALARIGGAGYVLASVVGTAAGAVVGYVGYKLIAFFMRQQASSTVESDDLVGVVGQVSVAIPPDGIGQVNVVVREKRMYPSARATAAGAGIEEGARVKIVSSSGNTVYVEKV